MSPSLVWGQTYTREEVHSIFAPGTRFTPQTGTWGLHGIVAIPDRPGDFVFFVTYGQKQGSHHFDEGITSDGVLTWQSQPKQRLSDRQIQGFIEHDEDRNTIYLFLREAARHPYKYLGRLKYLSHDAEREQPVHFKWQIIDWNGGEATHPEMPIQPLAMGTGSLPEEKLHPSSPPGRRPNGQGRAESTQRFRARKVADRARQDARNRELGLSGELLVLEYERTALRRAGFPELAASIRHVSVIEGDGAGYDILSFEPNGAKKYIEVKTTTGGAESDFFVSSAEVAFAQVHAKSYYLYRVFDFDRASGSASFYVVSGSLEKQFALIATQFRAAR